jgi:hypothetical protein
MQSGTTRVTTVRHLPRAVDDGCSTRRSQMPAHRSVLTLASVLAIGLAAVPALADPSGPAVPGNPAVNCRVASMGGGADDRRILYSSDCAPMQSLNVVRKDRLSVPRGYGGTRTPIMGGGQVAGWEGGRDGGPVYAPDAPPREAGPLAWGR